MGQEKYPEWFHAVSPLGSEHILAPSSVGEMWAPGSRQGPPGELWPLSLSLSLPFPVDMELRAAWQPKDVHSGVEVGKRGKTLGPNCFRHRQRRRIDNELRNCIIVSGQPRRKNWTQLSSYKLGMREMVEAVKKTSFRKKKGITRTWVSSFGRGLLSCPRMIIRASSPRASIFPFKQGRWVLYALF